MSRLENVKRYINPQNKEDLISVTLVTDFTNFENISEMNGKSGLLEVDNKAYLVINLEDLEYINAYVKKVN